MRCKQCKQNQKGTPLTFEPKVRINWSMTSHFSLLSSTCRPLNGSRTLTLTSSLPPTDFRPSINWIFKMKQKEVVSVGNNEIQTAANLCFLMPSQPGQLYQGAIKTQIHEKLKILKTPTMKTMQHRHFLLQWRQTGPEISDTIGWYFAQHWTGLPPLEQKMPVLSIHWSGVLSVLFVCYMAGVMWSSCHLGTHSVYTTQLCNPVSEFAVSLHAKPHM